MKRLTAIDLVRGLVMIIMALDHTRDLIHINGFDQSPTDLATTSIPLFFTRWITHICAPAFLFLSGISSFLARQKGESIGSTRKHYLIRGLWLLVLEFTLVNFALWFDIHFSVWIFNVLAAIGTAYLLLALLLPLGSRVIGIIGLVILLTHNLLVLLPQDAALVQYLRFLFFPGAIPLPGEKLFIVGYGPIPWAALLFVGYSAGPIFTGDAKARKTWLLRMGIAAIALFFVLRIINIYGDPSPWRFQDKPGFTLLSFLNLTKYPPSLQYASLFIGIVLLLLRFSENLKGAVARWVMVFGKVPLFYFVVHWYVIRIFLFLMVFAQGFGVKDMVFGFSFGRPLKGSGLDLWGVYLIWALVVVLMYPLCKAYGKYKEKHKEKKWVRYM